MKTITLRYNPGNNLANSLVNSIRYAGVFQIVEEEPPYNKQFVKEILESRESKGVVINTDDLWK
jgi:hypothetical protein